MQPAQPTPLAGLVKSLAGLEFTLNEFTLLKWPQQVRDLNPIEHLWDVVELGDSHYGCAADKSAATA